MTTSQIVKVHWPGVGRGPWEFQMYVQAQSGACTHWDCYIQAAKLGFFDTMFGMPVQEYRTQHPATIWSN